MFTPESDRRIWLYTQPTDMRKSYDGLSALVASALNEDPARGDLFVFVNRRQTHLKILYFDQFGYCLWCKRLERGQYHGVLSGPGKRSLNWTELRLIVEGLEVKKVRQYRRHHVR